MTGIMIDITLIIAGSILMATFIGYAYRRKSIHEEAARAAVVFNDKILTELEGLYPIPRHLDINIFDRFIGSIPVIKSAAAEFRPFVPARNRTSFDEALQNYCSHCSKITWESCTAFNIIPGLRKPEDEGPKEIFRQHVNALLSFTKLTRTN